MIETAGELIKILQLFDPNTKLGDKIEEVVLNRYGDIRFDFYNAFILNKSTAQLFDLDS